MPIQTLRSSTPNEFAANMMTIEEHLQGVRPRYTYREYYNAKSDLTQVMYSSRPTFVHGLCKHLLYQDNTWRYAAVVANPHVLHTQLLPLTGKRAAIHLTSSASTVLIVPRLNLPSWRKALARAVVKRSNWRGYRFITGLDDFMYAVDSGDLIVVPDTITHLLDEFIFSAIYIDAGANILDLAFAPDHIHARNIFTFHNMHVVDSAEHAMACVPQECRSLQMKSNTVSDEALSSFAEIFALASDNDTIDVPSIASSTLAVSNPAIESEPLTSCIMGLSNNTFARFEEALSTMTEASQHERDECFICLSQCAGLPVVTGCCNHAVCLKCARQAGADVKCPMCRRDKHALQLVGDLDTKAIEGVYASLMEPSITKVILDLIDNEMASRKPFFIHIAFDMADIISRLFFGELGEIGRAYEMVQAAVCKRLRSVNFSKRGCKKVLYIDDAGQHRPDTRSQLNHFIAGGSFVALRRTTKNTLWKFEAETSYNDYRTVHVTVSGIAPPASVNRFTTASDIEYIKLVVKDRAP